MKLLIFISSLFLSVTCFAQYEFEHTKDVQCTNIKNQSRTGTCWSFATSSFIESELMRMGKGNHDLSEMYVVRNIYKDKAQNYMLRQGKANFSQGSLSHDLIRMIASKGVVPESIYSGLAEGDTAHNHSEMEAVLKGMMDAVLKSKKPSQKWKSAFDAVLDTYMGPCPESFEYNGKMTSPKELASDLGLDSKEYVSLTSFSHHPYYEKFILEIPDNYSNGYFYNIPLEELMTIMDQAVDQGYTVAWDGDVSEKGFSAREGIAVLPMDEKREDLFKQPGDEIEANASVRQAQFENYTTTDDHLMHLVGKAKDQNGTPYYIIKNSWGEISPYKGYMYMSETYAKMKTVAIMVHKDVLTQKVKDLVAEDD